MELDGADNSVKRELLEAAESAFSEAVTKEAGKLDWMERSAMAEDKDKVIKLNDNDGNNDNTLTRVASSSGRCRRRMSGGGSCPRGPGPRG